jgi:hypothetical protein
MAVIVKEPERELIVQLTKNAAMVSPDMASYEIANALTNEVIINKDGKSYKILPINDNKEKSPLEDIPYITADITTQEIVNLIRESRAGI